MSDRQHTATYAPDGDGYLVSCPEGCKLGTSARQPDEAGARKRVELHQMMTRPLTAGQRHTVTAARVGRRKDAITAQRYTLTFSKLRSLTFGPYSFRDARAQLETGALLPPVQARNLLLDACADGEATTLYDPEG